jgi:hypothetical protein
MLPVQVATYNAADDQVSRSRPCWAVRGEIQREVIMPSLLQVAKRYGAQVVTPNAALPRLALETAHAVASGRASATDADKVYVAYFDSVMVRSRVQSAGSRKAQVSKLRQIMLLAEERTTQAPDLLLRVEKMHRELARRRS